MSERSEVLEIQGRMIEIHQTRDKLFSDLVADLGVYDPTAGINLDQLTKFAREIIQLNTEFAEKQGRHKEIIKARAK